MRTSTTTRELWLIDGEPYRRASADEISFLQAMPGAPHVMFACECGCAWWTTKNIALSASGHFNGMRRLFYCGDDRECECEGTSTLVCIVPVKEQHDA